MIYSPKSMVTASVVAAGMALGSVGTAWAQNPSHLEHDHSAGTIMFEYDYMDMRMDGMRKGTDNVSTTSVLNDFNMSPTYMNMDMHMFMPMYNFTSQLSVMAMFNYLKNEMGMTNGMMNPTMETEGLGDTQVNVAYKFMENKLAAGLTVNIPTGSVDETVMMMGNEIPAPYAMELGTGTYDVTPTFTYLGAYYRVRYGAQASYTVHTGDNDNGYTWGDKARAMGWLRLPMGELTWTGELEYVNQAEIDGKDDRIIAMLEGMSPTYVAANTGGSWVYATLGVDVPVNLFTVGLDFSLPVYQDLNGLQMRQVSTTTISLQAMF